MRVIVDHDLCEANGVCMSKAPEVFDIDMENRMILLQERPAPDLAAKVRLAVDRCPRGALSLADD